MDDALFGDAAAEASPSMDQSQSGGIANWQVKLLREALDARGITDMTERQRLVEDLVGHPVGSLRELTSTQARSLSEQLAALTRTPGKARGGSSWDDRDEDTWIDRL